MTRQEFKRLEGIEVEKAIAKERAENWVSPRATAECPVPVDTGITVLHRPRTPGVPVWAILSDIESGESFCVSMPLFNPDAAREMQEALDFG